jgi:predicted GNAT family N-acyltransferase
MLIQGKILSYGDDLSEAYAIRREVFIKEEGIPEEIEFDELDAEAMHVVVYENNDQKKAVATGRINYDGENCQISRIAVLKEFRGRMYGDFTVRMLLNKAFSADIKIVTINAQQSAIEFYKKIGFQCTGSEFIEAEILYCKMTIYAKDIVKLCKQTT